MKRSKKLKLQKTVNAIVEAKTLTEAYLRTHPESTVESAKKNQYRLLKNPQIQEELNKVLGNTKPIEVTRDRLVAILGTVISRWHQGLEKTSDLLRTVELLSNLVPDFADKKEIHEYKHLSEEELDKEIQKKYQNLLGRN